MISLRYKQDYLYIKESSKNIYQNRIECLPFIWKKLRVWMALITEWLSKLSSKSGDTRGSNSISLLKHFSTDDTRLINGFDTWNERIRGG